jgi:hypothetical protein
MIQSVDKLKEGTYIINDKIVISDIDWYNSDDISYNISYDENTMTAEEAKKITDEFILESLKNILKGNE